jgi:hypothetical protein
MAHASVSDGPLVLGAHFKTEDSAKQFAISSHALVSPSQVVLTLGVIYTLLESQATYTKL